MQQGKAKRRRLLASLEILREESDHAHPIHMHTLLARLAEQGIAAERKSLYEDFEAMRGVGFDVTYRHPLGWYLASKRLKNAEVRLLADIICAAHALSPEQSSDLIEKIASLGSMHEKEALKRSIHLQGRPKAASVGLYTCIDQLQEAMREGKTISFQYLAYTREKMKMAKRGGERYIASPHALIWNYENYYLVADDHLNNELRHYRVDKMQGLKLLSLEARKTPAGFDPAAYAARHFSMYGGKEARVQIRCENALVGVLIDRFGEEVSITPEGKDHILCEAEVALSAQFYGWLFGLGTGAQLKAPYWAVQDYQKTLRETAERHKGFS